MEIWEYLVKLGSPAIVLMGVAVYWLQRQLKAEREHVKELNAQILQQANEHLKRILDAARILEEAIKILRNPRE